MGAVVLLLAVVGLIVCVPAAIRFAAESEMRHVRVLRRKVLGKDYEVLDLCQIGGPNGERPEIPLAELVSAGIT